MMNVTDSGQDRDTRMRFMRIDAKTGELLREFWKVVEPAPGERLPYSLRGTDEARGRPPRRSRSAR